MAYVERSLAAGEKILARARFHWLYVLGAWLCLILFGIFIVGIVMFFHMMIRKWTTDIVVTNHRFIMKTGLFSLRTQEIAVPNIEGVEVTESFWGRLFDFGKVRIEGTGVDAIVTPTIAHPIEFRRAIETAKESVSK